MTKDIALALYLAIPVILLGVTFPLALRLTKSQKSVKSHIQKLFDAPFVTLLSVVLAVFFILVSVPKLIAMEGIRGAFDAWGFSPSTVYLIGVTEFLAGIALLSTAAAPLASGILAVLMFGATVTHLGSGQIALAIIPAVLFVLVAYVGIARALQKRGMWLELTRTDIG